MLVSECVAEARLHWKLAATFPAGRAANHDALLVAH